MSMEMFGKTPKKVPEWSKEYLTNKRRSSWMNSKKKYYNKTLAEFPNEIMHRRIMFEKITWEYFTSNLRRISQWNPRTNRNNAWRNARKHSWRISSIKVITYCRRRYWWNLKRNTETVFEKKKMREIYTGIQRGETSSKEIPWKS